MEQRTNSPYPAHRPAGAGRSSASCWSSATGPLRLERPRPRLALLPGRVPPAGRREVRRRQGRRRCPTGIQQVWVAGLRRADRCITCHQAVAWKGFEQAEEPCRTHPPEPLKTHPVERVRLHVVPRRPGLGHRHRRPRTARSRTGRSRCSAASLGEAYSLADNKNALLQMNCNVCHRYDRETHGRRRDQPRQAAGRREGLPRLPRDQRRGGTIGPDLTDGRREGARAVRLRPAVGPADRVRLARRALQGSARARRRTR